MSSETATTTSGSSGQVEIQLRKCEVCSKNCSNQCSNCRKASYCSKECQVAHRSEHKVDCFPLKLAKNADNLEYPGVVTRDNHWVATRHIKQGEIIFKEKPIIDGPSSAFHLEPISENRKAVNFLPVCLSCCKILSKDAEADVNRCSKCKWYMCGSNCEKDPRHKMECDLFSRVGLIPIAGQSLDYNFICYLRTIFYKFTQPKKWAQLMSLKGAYVLAVERCGEEGIQLECDRALDFLLEGCGLRFQVTRDMVLTVLSLWKAYGFEDIYSVHEFSLIGIYPKTLYITNSCVPTCGSFPDPNPKGTTSRLLATMDIADSEILGRMNVEGGWMKATQQRRERLAIYGAKFICRCDRCKDPTECGTYFSALKCPKKCRANYLTTTNGGNLGYILPLNPLSDNTDWKCNNPTCQSTFDSIRVAKILEPISAEVQATLTQASHQGFDNFFRDVTDADKALVRSMESNIEKYKNVLHPNHQLIYELTFKMLLGTSALLVPSPLKMDTRVMMPLRDVTSGEPDIHFGARTAQKQQERALYCLEIVDRIQPGFLPVRGKVLWLLAMAKWVSLLDMRKMIGMDIPGVCSREMSKREIEEAQKVTRDAENALKADNSLNNQVLVHALDLHRNGIVQAYTRNPLLGFNFQQAQ